MQFQDFFVAADYFETQGCDRTGWFNNFELSTSSETLEIEDVYKHLQDLDISPLVSEMNTGFLDRLLPVGIRTVFRAHSYMTKWAIVQIASPQLGLQKREQRMEYFLRAIEVCRARSSPLENDNSAIHPIQRPCIRSFVETVLTSAILSSHSRMFHRAWQNVALQRNVAVDSLLSLTSRSNVPHTARPKQKLTPDMGWVIERMLEILSMADTVPSLSATGSALINYDKRRCAPVSFHFVDCLSCADPYPIS